MILNRNCFSILLILIIALGSFFIWRNYEQYKKDAYSEILEAVQIDAALMKQDIDRTKMLAVSLANTEPAQDLDVSKIEQLFQSFFPYQPGIINMWLTDTAGNPIAAYPLNKNHGNNYKDRSYFNYAMSGQTTISDSFTGAYTKVPVIIIATPINKDDQIVGMLVLTLKPTYFRKALSSTANFIMDSQSNILFEPESETYFAASSQEAIYYDSLFKDHQEPVFEVVTPAGKKAIIATASIANTNWRIVIVREQQILSWYFKGIATPTLIILFMIIPIFLIIFQNKKLLFRYEQGLLAQKLETAEKEVETGLLTKELAASIAHEIRNPLTAIMGFTQVLDKNNKNERQAEVIRIIIEEAQQVENIITEFLQFAKGNLHETDAYRPYKLEDIVREIKPLIESIAKQKQLEIKYNFCSNLPPGKIAKGQIKQVLINLIKNAIEATDERGQITLTTYLDQGYVCIDISDSGPGIPREIYDKIGQRFFTTKETGNGLGLAICQRIMQNHRGLLTFKNNPTKGATFTIGVPKDQSFQNN